MLWISGMIKEDFKTAHCKNVNVNLCQNIYNLIVHFGVYSSKELHFNAIHTVVYMLWWTYIVEYIQ